MNNKKRHGIHPRKCSAQMLDEIKKLKEQGVAVPVIAERFGYNKRTIFRLLAEHNQTGGNGGFAMSS